DSHLSCSVPGSGRRLLGKSFAFIHLPVLYGKRSGKKRVSACRLSTTDPGKRCQPSRPTWNQPIASRQTPGPDTRYHAFHAAAGGGTGWAKTSDRAGLNRSQYLKMGQRAAKKTWSLEGLRYDPGHGAGYEADFMFLDRSRPPCRRSSVSPTFSAGSKRCSTRWPRTMCRMS